MGNEFQVWAEDKDTEDWVCVQTLGDPGRYKNKIIYIYMYVRMYVSFFRLFTALLY